VEVVIMCNGVQWFGGWLVSFNAEPPSTASTSRLRLMAAHAANEVDAFPQSQLTQPAEKCISLRLCVETATSSYPRENEAGDQQKQSPTHRQRLKTDALE